MKSLFKYVVAPILTAIIVYFIYNHFNSSYNKPIIRFTLSYGIPVEESGSFDVFAQQLDIKNVGSTEATNININIIGYILSNKIIKNSGSDIYNVFEDKNGIKLNIVYNKLLPGGYVRILLKVKGSSIQTKDISISHSLGTGQEALESSDRPFSSTLVFSLFYWVLMLGWLVYIIRTGAIDILESTANYDQVGIMKRKKPFYITEAKWTKILNKAIDGYFDKDGDYAYLNPDNSGSFTILNGFKPKFIKDEEWQRVIARAEKRYVNLFLSNVNLSYHSMQISKLLSTEKPKLIRESVWDDLKIKASSHYLNVLIREYNIYTEYKDILVSISRRPTGLLDEDWEKYKKYLADIYFRNMATDIESAESPIEFVSTQNINILQSERRNNIERKAYLFEVAKIWQAMDYKSAKHFIETPKPTWIIEYDFNKLLEIALKIVESYDGIEKHRSLNAELSNMTDKVKEDVRILEEKLSFIDRILNYDKDAINKLEKESTLFATGNIANLRKISDILKKEKNTTS